MVIAIFSDIHSNLEALEVFFNQVYGKVDRYICLGDIVGYGPDPSPCISIVRNICGAEWAVKGNHDRALISPKETSNFNFVAAEAIFWTLDRVSETDIEYIKSLSDVIDYNGYIFTHGGLIDIDEYITSISSATRNLNRLSRLGKRIMFYGHTHIPAIWSSKGFQPIEYGKKIYLDKNELYLINPGSIGQPRDNSPLGSYLLFDESDTSVVFRRFEYNVRETYRKITSRGLPEYLGRRLMFGV
ncbi:MAG: metallophosphoesterase family protein [Spirochaetia bacterium]|nr:metallophosphatase family protein [Spirochaetota bacterium]MCX8096857.1 metallophosphatase family protein [Spirochaetota bacterium]MDW8111791.1 metallophosphoesterase family protein [Spirochaetia bacterium]